MSTLLTRGVSREHETQGTHISGGPAQRDKVEAGIRTSLVNRCLDAVSPPPADEGQRYDEVVKRRTAARDSVFPASERSDFANDFNNCGFYDLAREWVQEVCGIRGYSYSREEIAIMAMFGPRRAAETLGIDLRSESAYHTTGSFANITLDAMNKSMMLGYTEAPSTWEQVFRVGEDAADFKDIHRIRLGSVPNIPIWEDDKKPAKLSISDARETYAVEARSAQIDFSYRLIVNDDMSAISRVPGMMGSAMRRTVNALPWSIVTSNPMMSDNVQLFSVASGLRKRPNVLTNGSPNSSTLQTMTAQMMQMRGENTPEGNEPDGPLGLTPRVIAGPSALRKSILQLVLSMYDTSNPGSLAYNTESGLKPVIEPLLDASSTAGFYLFADHRQIDTIEMTFLRGQRKPITRQTLDIQTLSQKFSILQSFGAKAMNHRGMQYCLGL